MTLQELMTNNSKDQIEALARAKGWKGDPARCSKLDLAHVALGTAPTDQPVETVPAAQPDAPIATEETVPVPAPSNVDAKNKNAVAQAIAAALASVKMGADVDEVRAIVHEELASIQPARIIVNAATSHAVKIEERTHPLFVKGLLLLQAKLNVLFVGPAGCGKSILLRHLAKGLGATKTCIVSGTAGASEAYLTGWRLPVEGGKWEFVCSEWLDAYRTDNSFCGLDELDGFDANMLMIAHEALANGHLFVPQATPNGNFKRGKGTVVAATANTYGNGADLIYAGRNQLDAATVDRFYVVEMGYDEGLEAAIAGRPYQPGAAWQAAAAPTAQELRAIGEWVAALREKVRVARLRRIVSTRMLQKAIAARLAGVPLIELKRDLLAGWTRDELSKVGE